jgi:hypothetical protein
MKRTSNNVKLGIVLGTAVLSTALTHGFGALRVGYDLPTGAKGHRGGVAVGADITLKEFGCPIPGTPSVALSASVDYLKSTHGSNLPICINAVVKEGPVFGSAGIGVNVGGGNVAHGVRFAGQISAGYNVSLGITPIFIQGSYFFLGKHGHGRRSSNAFGFYAGIRL